MFRTARIAIAIAAASAAAALALPSAASAAGCTETHDTSAPTYNVSLCGVSDIDQFRTGLPSNGNSFCGPGSLYNVLNGMYHRQGLPSNIGIVSMATADASYYWGTAFVNGLGTYAGGSEDGTSAGDNRTAFKKATANADANGWNLATGVVDTMTTLEFGHAIAQRLDKAPVQMWYGRYSQSDNGFYLERNGGHIVTVVSAKGSTGTGQVELLLHDPGRAADHGIGDYLDTQSAPRLEKVTLKRVAFNVMKDGVVEIRYRWELTGDNYIGATRQMVEGFNWFSATKG